MPEAGGGDGSNGRGVDGIAPAFVVHKVKEPVLLDWAAERNSECIADKLLARDAGPVEKKAIGASERIAHVFVKGAMDQVGAAFRNQGDLRAGAVALIGGGILRGGAELLRGIERDAQHAA